MFIRTLVILSAVGILSTLAGCKPAPSGTTNADSAAGTATSQSPDSGMAETIKTTLAKLEPADRAAAEAQKICPVSGEPLGSMGVPAKVHVNDRDVFICCEGCEDTLKADPDQYLAKLEQQ